MKERLTLFFTLLQPLTCIFGVKLQMTVAA